MARTSSFLFAITATLAVQPGNAVSLKYAEDRNSLSDSSLARAVPADKGSDVTDLISVLRLTANATAHDAFPKISLPPFNPNAILSHLTDKINQTLAKVDSKVVLLVDKLDQKSNQLLAKSNATWTRYVIQLNDTLSNSLETVAGYVRAVQALTSVLSSNVDVPQIADALDSLTTCLDKFSDASSLAQNISRAEHLAYADAYKGIERINGSLYDGLAFALDGTSKLEPGFAQLSSKALSMIKNLPIPSIPSVVLSTIEDLFDVLKITVKNLHTQADRAMTTLVSTAEESSFLAIKMLLADEIAYNATHSDASRVAPLFAAMLAVGAAAFH